MHFLYEPVKSGRQVIIYTRGRLVVIIYALHWRYDKFCEAILVNVDGINVSDDNYDMIEL